MRDSNPAAPDAEPVRAGGATPGIAVSGIATAVILAGYAVAALIAVATPASAHVKWFVTCDSSDDPLPLHAVFTAPFWLFSALFVMLFYFACVIEDSRVGRWLSDILDRWTAPLHQRADVLLRSATAVFFALLWSDGSLILTPDLKDNHAWLSTIQVLIALYLSARATLPAAAVAVLVLYGYGVATYGLFHMLDYPFFLGLAAYFMLSVLKNSWLGSRRFDFLRWTVALSLMWPSMENFLYPSWVAPVALAHPKLTLGFDVATFVTALGAVEFGLTFALLWTPLVRRLAAAVLALVFSAVTLYLGKMDGMGHLMIVMILLLVLADPGKKQARCRPEVAPIVGGTALLALIFVYVGTHALYYGPTEAAVVPLMSGAALLTVGLLSLRSPAVIAQRASSTMRIAGPERRWAKQGRADLLPPPKPPRHAIARPMTRYESFIEKLQAAELPRDPEPVSNPDATRSAAENPQSTGAAATSGRDS